MGEKAIRSVMNRARESLGPIQKPYHYEFYTESELQSLPDTVQSLELDVEETLTQGFLSSGVLTPEPIYQARRERDHGLILLLDTSLSMKGEKLALLGVTVAAVAMSLPKESIAILGFDSEVHAIKKFGEVTTPEECVEHLLSIPPGGFTNIELSLLTAKEWIQASGYQNARVILVSDGRYTEGKHPVALAASFPFVYAVKIGKDPTGREIMREIADSGLGRFTEVREMNELPRVLLHSIRAWVK